MLDIYPVWFAAQFINFILLLIILNAILFKPFLRLFKERDDNTRGALESARTMDKEKDGVLSQIDAKLTEARNKARAAFEDLSKEGMDIQRQVLDTAHKEAVDINRKSGEALTAATEKARASLKSDVEAFSRQIVAKLVGA